MLQTGYLTITEIDQKARTPLYVLNYPNFEVKQAFITYLFDSFTQNELGEIQPAAENLRNYLQTENLEGFMNIIRALFAKIPYPLHIEQEAYYHSLFYMILVLMGVEIDLEVLTDKGRIDGVLAFEEKIYLIEFKYGKAGSKMDSLTNKALKQIKAKNYDERFLNDPRPRVYLGVGFAGKEIGYKKRSCENCSVITDNILDAANCVFCKNDPSHIYDLLQSQFLDERHFMILFVITKCEAWLKNESYRKKLEAAFETRYKVILKLINQAENVVGVLIPVKTLGCIEFTHINYQESEQEMIFVRKPNLRFKSENIDQPLRYALAFALLQHHQNRGRWNKLIRWLSNQDIAFQRALTEFTEARSHTFKIYGNSSLIEVTK